MDECFSKYYILNGDLLPSHTYDNSLLYEGDSVYEVIRMINGTPVFFNDHIERLKNSVRLQNRQMLSGKVELRNDILRLTGSENIKEANLKIVFNYNGVSCNYLVYFIEPIYPTLEQYRDGVKGILFYAERKDPESKVFNHKLRSDIYHKLILDGAYEALLVDHQNHITEGSRSNIFFIKGNVVYTAPEKIILSGITRKYILEICREQSIRVLFECARADRIEEFDSAFMSGTSPMVLPFSFIENKQFDVKLPLMTELRRLYIGKAEASISQFISD
jgi:branched-chain amino acid aminotransferase